MSQMIERAVVRPLAWGRVDRWFAIALATGQEYTIFEEEGECWVVLNGTIEPFDTIEAAKAAAQANHDARILSALTQPSPSPVAAEGYVLVPVDDATRQVADSALPIEMIHAGIDALEQVSADQAHYVAGETADWDQGMVAVAVYRAMLAARPPIGETVLGAGDDKALMHQLCKLHELWLAESQEESHVHVYDDRDLMGWARLVLSAAARIDRLSRTAPPLASTQEGEAP